LTNNTWEQVGMTKSGTNVTFYVNGASVGTITTAQATLPTETNTEYIGWDPAQTTGIDGFLDELEYYQSALSPGWIQTEYNNENSPSTFSTLSNVETSIYAPTLSQIMRGGKWFNSSGVIQPFTF